MPPFTFKLLTLTYFTAIYLATEAADTCSAASCIHGIPGRDGKVGRDGIPGRDGRDGIAFVNGTVGQPGPPGVQGPHGPPGALNDTEQQQLKNDILKMVREEIFWLGCCNTATSTVSTTSQANNPTESVYQRTSTPQPTPTPEPPCELNATSCKELYQCNQTTPSGYYNITTPQGVERVYCEMDTTNCGSMTGGWTRVANIDMTDENNICPQNAYFTVQSSIRMCTSSNNAAGCSSTVTFPAHMIPYTKVCGRARGYQYGSTDAYHQYHQGQSTIDGFYVDGLSVTHGSPRKHIWTFAAGLSKLAYYPDYNSYNCPCAVHTGPASPPFVGENYFCESGLNGVATQQNIIWYLDDPLWDSQGCASGSTCCNRGGPWFNITLNEETSDDIEARWCLSHEGEDVGVNQLEIYIN